MKGPRCSLQPPQGLGARGALVGAGRTGLSIQKGAVAVRVSL